LDCVRNAGKATRFEAAPSKAESAIDELLTEVDRGAAKALERKDLRGLILSSNPEPRR